LADHVVVARKTGTDKELPKAATLATRVDDAIRRLPQQLEERLLDEIARRDRRPSVLGKVALWLLLLWFPLLQPISAGLLEMFAETGTLNLAHGLYRIVSALSAIHLLAGFAVVAAVYAAILAGMYARAVRAVGTSRSEQTVASPITDTVDELLVAEIVVPLVTPFEERLERATTLRERLASFAPTRDVS
jgi:hypothetical protein